MPVAILISDLCQVTRGSLLARLARAGQLGPARCSGLAVQLRDPQLEGRALWAWGCELSRAVRRIGASLLVNDRLDLALALGADGVHLGRTSVAVAEARAMLGPDVWITTSAHAAAEVVEAARSGADAALLSPIFASPGKTTPLGLAALTRAKEGLAEAGLTTSLVALGGVNAARAPSCLDAGADGIAVVRGDLSSTLATLLAT